MSKVKGFFKGLGSFIKKHKKLFVVLLIIVVVLVVLRVRASKNKTLTDVDTSTVTTTVEKMDLQKSVSVTGTLAASDTASVTSTLTGVSVSKINYEVGDYVEAGTVVVEMDGDDLEQKLADVSESATINNMQAAHSVENYEDEIEDIQEYLDKYKYVYENLIYLKKTDTEKYQSELQAVATEYDNEFSISTYESKEDQLEEAEYNLKLAQLQQTQTAGQNEEQYESAQDDIADTQITAPISGYITAINVEEGNNYTQGSTIFTISDTSSYVVEATVDEYDIASLSEGLECVVKFDATDDDEFEGELTYVAMTSDSTTSTSTSSYGASSSSSSGYAIKITLTDTDDRLRAGMTAKASVILESVSDVLAVPYDCVETDKDGNSYVTAVDEDGNETKVTVTKGMESDYYVEISGDDVTEGMTIKATASSGTASSSDDVMMMFDMSDGSDMGGGQGGGQGGGDMGGGAPGGMN